MFPVKSYVKDSVEKMDFLPHKMRIFTWKFLRKSPAFSNLDFSRFLDLTQELLDNSAAFFFSEDDHVHCTWPMGCKWLETSPPSTEAVGSKTRLVKWPEAIKGRHAHLFFPPIIVVFFPPVVVVFFSLIVVTV